MKHLPKHLRPRWRYVAIDLEAHPDASLSRGSFQRALWYAAGNLLGDAGSADADLKLLTFAFDDGEGKPSSGPGTVTSGKRAQRSPAYPPSTRNRSGSTFAGFRGRYVPVKKDIWVVRAENTPGETLCSRGPSTRSSAMTTRSTC